MKDYQFSPAQTDEVIRLMDATNGKFVASPSHRIIKNRRWLIIAPLENTASAHIIIEENQSGIIYPDGDLQFRKLNAHDKDIFSNEPRNALLDAGKIQFPLILRKWKTGDYFYPLGMKKEEAGPVFHRPEIIQDSQGKSLGFGDGQPDYLGNRSPDRQPFLFNPL